MAAAQPPVNLLTVFNSKGQLHTFWTKAVQSVCFVACWSCIALKTPVPLDYCKNQTDYCMQCVHRCWIQKLVVAVSITWPKSLESSSTNLRAASPINTDDKHHLALKYWLPNFASNKQTKPKTKKKGNTAGFGRGQCASQLPLLLHFTARQCLVSLD